MLSQCELTERASATQTCPLPIFLSPHSNTHSYTQSDLGFRLGFPGVSDGKDSACNVGDLGLIPGLGISPGDGKGYLLQYSGVENFMDSPCDSK